MNVAFGREEIVEVAGTKVAPLDLHQLCRTLVSSLVDPAVDPFVLLAAIQSDQPPRQVIMDRRAGARRQDQAEERQFSICRPKKKVVSNALTHTAGRVGSPELVGEPVLIVEEVGEDRTKHLYGNGSIGLLVGYSPYIADEGSDERYINVIGVHEKSGLTGKPSATQ
jgi:hypothetical protein